MLRSDLELVRDEAKRLINRIDLLIELGDQQAQREHAERVRATKTYDLKPGALRYVAPDSKWRPLTRITCGHPKESGAVKRASMDLTRALSDLRNPYRNGN